MPGRIDNQVDFLTGYVQAHMWSNLAAAKGDETAREVRDLFSDFMTPGQIAEAERLAREWKPKQ